MKDQDSTFTPLSDKFVTSRDSNHIIKHKDILKNELKKNGILILSSPIKATYDKPFTLPILRRNEAMFKIDIKIKGEI